MNLPITSWNRTLRTLGYKVVRKAYQKRKSESKLEQHQYEVLEPRQMLVGDTGLVVQADLDQLLGTVDNPLVARLGQFDANASSDLAVLSASGQLTIATNGDDGTWQSRQTVDLGVGQLHGLELALVNDDVFSDLVLQGPDNIFIAINDGEGHFSVAQTLTPLAAGDMGPGSSSSLRMETGDFNGDFVFDIAALAPGVDQVVVYLGVGDGTFASPIIESTDGSGPTSITAGDFIGNGFPDLAIGHADGTVTFLQNEDGTSFTNRPDLTVSGFSSITDLASDDLDGDGDTDIVVASGDQLTILDNEKSQLATEPAITNGTFGLGLTTWNVEVVGHRSEAQAGSVIAQSGFAQLVENESFLVSINQDFTVPDNPQTIQVDILALGLEDPAGGIPDAFEISILDENGNSLVPTFRPDATSFFNVNPGDVVETAAGVTFDGKTVTVDISAIPVGTAATIYFDLIGNGPGNGSTVTIDNVRVTPEIEFDSSFETTTLTGPFVNVNQIAIDDVDGDDRLDIAATDAGNDKLLVFNGKPGGTFEREEIDLSGSGTGLVSLDTAPLTSGDGVSDLVVLAANSNVAISPLAADELAPTAVLLSPMPSQTNTGSISQIDIQFDELMRDIDPSDPMSVTNPANYTVTFLGPDGIEGTGDDQALVITDVSYEPLTGVVTLDIDPASTPLEDGVYIVTLDSTNLKDASDNLLSNGDPVEFTFTMNSTGPVIDPIDPLISVEGGIVEIMTGFTDAGGAIPYDATIDWGDGSVTDLNMLDFVAGAGMLAANHIYADNGTYNVTLTVQDFNDVSTQAFTTIQVTNADPDAVVTSASLDAVRNEALDLILANFSDVGFDNVNTGTTESFTATIDWGDGTTTAGVIDSITGVPGTPSTGNISGQHTYTAVGQYTISITLSDDDGGSDTVEIFVNVENDAPEFTNVGTIAGNEGETVSLNAAFTDNDASGTYVSSIDWGDGSTSVGNVTYAGGTGTITGDHVYGDNGTYQVSVDVTDPAGNSGADTTNAFIGNVAPGIDPIGDQSVDVAATFVLPQIQFSDPGFKVDGVSDETFTVDIDWGDGNVTTDATVVLVLGSEGVATVGTVDVDHVYNQPGVFDVTITVSDDDSGIGTETLEVTVDNVLPEIDTIQPISADEGDSVSVDVGFTDPRIDQTYTASVDWGDGTTTTATVVFAAGAGTIESDHVYADNGSYSITVTLNDASLQTVDSSATATIGNVVPAFSVQQADVTIDVGVPLLLEDIEFTDPGFTSGATVETFGATFDWGDGNSTTGTVDVTQGSAGVLTVGLIDATYTFGTVGIFAATITLTDDDGGVATMAFNVNVQAVDPGGKASTRFFVVDKTADKAFRYDPLGVANGSFATTGSYNARGAATWTTGNPLWVVDHDRNVYVYDSDGETLLGSWSAGTIKNPEGIATDGVSIWIVDKSKKTVYFYQNAASLRSGSLSPTSSFSLDNQNKNPAGLTTDGANLWVVDQTDDNVYVYNTGGSLQSTWALDASNRNARGITIDPSGGNGIWVVDKVDNRVYEYATALPSESSQSATGWFALDPENHNPEGIADPVTLINIGDTVTDDISVAGEIDQWQFNVVAGQRVFFDFLSVANGRVYIELIAPDSSTVFTDNATSPGFLDRGAIELDQNGIYELVVSGSATGTPSYSFELVDVPALTPTSINFGDVISDTTTIVGEDKIYVFNGTAGQRVYFDRQVESSSGTFTWRVFDPAENQVFSNSFDDAGPIELTATGQYRLEMDGNGVRVGSFQFAVADVPPIVTTTIDVGDVVSGATTIQGEDKHFVFSGTAGQRIYFDRQAESANAVYSWRVFDAAENQLFSNGFDDAGPIELPATGQYRLEMNGNGDRVGSFQFQVVDVPAIVTTTINVGDVVSGATTIQGEDQHFVFNATAGQRIYFDRQAESANAVYSWRVFDAAENQLFSNGFDDAGPIELPATGQYRLEMNGNGDRVGSFQFQVVDVPAIVTTTINVGDVVSGATTIQGEDQHFVFNATAGQRIYFDRQAESANAVYSWRVFDAAENQLFSNGFDDAGPIELPATGQYRLEMNGNGDRVGSFQFQVVDVPAIVTTTINVGDVVSGATTIQGEDQHFVFSGTAGQRIFFDRQVESANAVYSWRVFDAAENQLFSNGFDDAGPIELPATGQYRLEMNGNGDRVGSFQFQVVDVPPIVPTTINIGDVVNDATTIQGEDLHYVFNAVAGQRVYFDKQAESANATFSWRLLDPAENVLFSNGFDDANTLALPSTGQYRLEMLGNGDKVGSFRFELVDVPPEVVLPVQSGEIVEGQIQIVGQTNRFTFDGVVGQKIFLDKRVENPSSTFQWFLLDPSEAVIASNGFDDIGVVELASAGEYSIRVDGVSTKTGEYEFAYYDVTPAPIIPITFNTPVAGDIDEPGQTQTYSFTANAGDPFSLDQIYNNADGVGFTLTSPSGSNLFSGVNTDQTIASLPETGTYTIFVDQIGGNTDYVGEYNFRIVDSVTIPGEPAAADLVVTSFSVPHSVTGNPAQFDVSWTVTNQGTVATDSATWLDRVFFSKDNVILDLNDRLRGSFEHVGTLNPGESYSRTETVTMPADFEGEVTIGITIDSINQVFENTNEPDNAVIQDIPTAIYSAPRSPSGQSGINLDIASGSIFPVGTLLDLTGQATSFAGSVNMIFILDVSGSVSGSPGLDANFDGVVDANDDVNLDGAIGDILDAEIGAVFQLVQTAIEQSDDVKVSAMSFNTAATLRDLSSISFNQTFLDPEADLDANGFADYVEALRKLRDGGGTNFQAPIVELGELLQRAEDVDQTFVYFLTDGESGLVPTAAEIQLIADAGVDFNAFQITGTSVSSSLQSIANGIDAGASTGSAQIVSDPNDLTLAILGTQEITDVLVNGQSVDLLDTEGNFSLGVTLQPGDNVFVVEAFSNGTLVATETVTLIGDAGSVFDIDSMVRINNLRESYLSTTFNRQSNQLHVDLTANNDDTFTYAPDIAGLFDPIDTPAVTLATSEGVDAAGNPFVVFDSEISTGTLAPGSATDFIPITFDNPSRARFGVDVQFLVTPNSPPVVLSTPVFVANPDEQYSYEVIGFDINGDNLTFTLISGPVGMTLNTTVASVGLLEWTPTLAEVGNHAVSVLIDDGRGGSVEHQFDVLVPTNAVNQPPIILSNPGTYVAVDEAFAYLVDAEDPDLDPLAYSFIDAPDGMTINSATGQIDWQTDAADEGNHQVVILVDDGEGGFDVQDFFLTVGLDAAASISGTKSTTSASQARVVLGHDVNTLASQFGNAQEQQFAVNVAQWISQDPTGSLLLVQGSTFNTSNFSPNVVSALQTAGFTVTVTPDNDQTLAELQAYDAVFVGINASTQTVVDNNALIQYVESGGGVYLHGGSLSLSLPAVEAAAWSVFLGHFGLAFDASAYNLNFPSNPVNSSHPIFAGITALGSQNGSNIIDLEPANPENEILVTSPAGDIYAVFDGAGNSPQPTLNWSIYLDLNTNGVRDAHEPATLTDASGFYSFDNIMPGTYVVAEEFSDGWQAVDPVSGQQTVTLTAGEMLNEVNFLNSTTGVNGNLPPRFTSTPVTDANVNDIYLYPAKVFDAEGDVVSFSLVNSPGLMSINSQTGLISWVPGQSDLGPQNVVIQVVDTPGNTQLQSFDIQVGSSLNGPVITSEPIRFAIPDESYVYPVIADDLDGDPVRFSLVSGPAGMAIDASTGELTWNPTVADLGTTVSVQIRATDFTGRNGYQVYDLSVRNANTPPVFVSEPIESASAGATYYYQAQAIDADDGVMYSLGQAIPGMTIDAFNGLITYEPTNGDVGSIFDISVVATDERGLTATQDFTITVTADTEGPVVEILTTGTLFTPGDVVTVQVRATDNVSVDTLDVTIEGNAVTLDALGQVTYTLTTPGLPTIFATATDTSGNVGTAEKRVRVIDPNDVTAPIVEIISPAIASSVTYLTDVFGSVIATDIDNWNLQYSLSGFNNWVTLASGTNEFNNQLIATFDPTLLANDNYDLRLFAQDFSGNFATTQIFVGVEGQAKLGNYALEFTDLSIPLAGIPIQIIRQYDTLNANHSGDFGYGWNLSIGEAGIRETIPVSQAELDGVPALFGGAESFFIGTRVYVTTPDGQRVGFTFDPVVSGGLLGAVWTPKFTADVDTDYELEVPPIALSQKGDGTFGLYLIGFNYNPRGYTLVSKDQMRYTYDQFEDLQTVTDRNDVTLTYTDSGIFSSTGESIQFIRDDLGRIEEIIDPAGNSLLYGYDGDGDLISVTDQVMLSTTMTYNDENAHYLETVTGPRGNLINEVKYDADGRFVGLFDALGNEVVNDFDLQTNTFVQTDRNGNPTTLIYDDRGNITEERDALGNSEFSEYGDPRHAHLETAITNKRGFTTRFTYDARGNVTLLEEPGGVFTRFEYDSSNNVTRTIGPALSDPGDGFADTLIDSFFADGEILATTIRERLNEADFTIVDSADLILGPEYDRDTETQLDSDYVLLANPGDYVTVGFNEIVEDRAGDDIFIVTPLFGGNFVNQGEMAEVSVTTDGVNYVTVAQIGLEPYAGVDLADAGIIGQVLGVRVTALPNSGGVGDDVFAVTAIQATTGEFRTTRNIYDENGNLAESVDALGNSQFQTTDGLGRPLTITNRNGNTTSYEYSQSIGLPSKITNPDLTFQTFTFNDMGQVLTQTNELGIVVTTETYDDAGKQLSVAGADGQLTTYQYDFDLLQSETVKINATDSQVTSYFYDANDRLNLQVDANGGEIELTYDDNGNVLSLTDPVENTTSYVLDELDRQIQETDPLNGITTYDFDEVGNLIEKLDRLDRKIEFVYDAMDRLTSEIWYDDVGALVQASTFSYDIFGNLLTASDPSSNYVYTYDVLDRLLTSDNAGTPNTPNVVLSYTNDNVGNRIQVVDNSGVTIDSEYGTRNELLSKTWYGGEVDDARVEFDYDATLNEVDTRRYSDLVGDGTTNLIGRSEKAYDDSDRLIRITHLDGSDVVLANYEYEFDLADRITRQTIDSNVVDYQYDLTGQLTAVDNSDPTVADEFYVYDLNGNRIESHLHGTGYVTGPNNQLLSDGEFNYDYDAEGNQIRKTNIATGEITEYEYDHRKRMVRATVKTSGGIVTSESQFVFDVFGRRIAVVTDADGAGSGTAVRENYVYDGDNVWTDYNEAGQANARYLFGDSIDSNIARWRAGQGTAWYLTDHLRTVRSLVGVAGTLVNQTTYDSFGQLLSESNSTLGDRYGFVGRELIPGQDSYFVRTRVLSQRTGRFTSQDSVRFKGRDGNLYRYVGNSSTNATDPFGSFVELTQLQLRLIVASTAAIPLIGLAVWAIFADPDDPFGNGGPTDPTQPTNPTPTAGGAVDAMDAFRKSKGRKSLLDALSGEGEFEK